MDQVRTAAGDDESHPLVRLMGLSARRREADREFDREEALCVRQARNGGATWQEIAWSLGVSRQAVHKKYGRR